MPFSLEPLEAKGLLYTGRGVLTGAELRSHAVAERQVAERGEFEYALVDLTDVTDLRVTSDDIRRQTEKDRRLAKLVPQLILAVVAPSDHMFGMARMYQTLAEDTGWTTQLFRRRREAEDWLAAVRAARRLPDTP